MFFIGIILGIIINNAFLILTKSMEVEETSRRPEVRVENVEREKTEIQQAWISPKEKNFEKKTLIFEKPRSLFKKMKKLLITSDFSNISAWDKSVPNEYESVEKLYSDNKCDCGGSGTQYDEQRTVDFNSTTKRRNSDFKTYIENHIFEYVESPLHVTGAFT